MTKIVNPGVNPRLVMGHFTDDEKRIIWNLGREWYVTHGGREITLGKTSTYRYMLIRPVNVYTEMFNLGQEIIVLFSPYETFETRSLDAIDYAIKQYQPLRVDRICSVLVSKDKSIESTLVNILKSDPESQIVVPFTYEELIDLNKQDAFFMRNRFKSHFYTRDLFAFEAPLKKDLYFFGRNDLIHRIVNRHRSNENSGLFGLRKTGKTSVIFGIVRALSKIGSNSVFIDCQNPAFHRRRWNKALWYIISEIKQKAKLTIQTQSEENYSEEHAPILFETELLEIYKKLRCKNILIIFDEIENITFNVSPSEHWAKELDFIYFWQTLRSLFQKLDNVFAYLIVGTNPMCIETPTIQGKDNPIYNQVPYEYIPSFDVPQTREMVRKLGRSMGLKFDEIIYGKLTEDFGGHPFLIRHVCSVVNRISSTIRPTFIDKTIYEQAKGVFHRDYSNYIEMILEVLVKFYGDEYEMLKYLARGDFRTFEELSQMSPLYTNHLLGYGIVRKHDSTYSFGIEAVHDYLAEQQKYKKLDQKPNEMLEEISERRNFVEPRIRHIVRLQMLAIHGRVTAGERILKVLGSRRSALCTSFSYDELFDPDKSKLLFDDLRKIIRRNWDCFKNIFGDDIDEFDTHMKAINKYRADAHAKQLNSSEMAYFRVCISAIEKQVEDFLG